MADTPTRLERVIGIVLNIGVTASSLCLAAGLISTVLGGHAATEWLLQAGLLILMATPVARVIVSIVEYAVERDWPFVALTSIVLLEVAMAAVAALVFNRRM
jgi:uncharacterized membrane protein